MEERGLGGAWSRYVLFFEDCSGVIYLVHSTVTASLERSGYLVMFLLTLFSTAYNFLFDPHLRPPNNPPDTPRTLSGGSAIPVLSDPAHPPPRNTRLPPGFLTYLLHPRCLWSSMAGCRSCVATIR